jgi:hypothetical protein
MRCANLRVVAQARTGARDLESEQVLDDSAAVAIWRPGPRFHHYLSNTDYADRGRSGPSALITTITPRHPASLSDSGDYNGYGAKEKMPQPSRNQTI